MVALPGDALLELLTSRTVLAAVLYGGIIVLYLVVRKRLDARRSRSPSGASKCPWRSRPWLSSMSVVLILRRRLPSAISCSRDRGRPAGRGRAVLRLSADLQPRGAGNRTTGSGCLLDIDRDRCMMTGELTGDVVRPGDPGYDAARMGWNLLFTPPPDVLSCSATADPGRRQRPDVGAAATTSPFRVRSGGHSLEGWSTSTTASSSTSADEVGRSSTSSAQHRHRRRRARTSWRR